jgi:hypothetical protein
MKKISTSFYPKISFPDFYYCLAFLLTLLPLLSSGQTSTATQDILPILECTEYIGNGKFRANFSYNNLNKKEVTVAETNSVLFIDGKPASGKPPRVFKAGQQQNVFSTEFESNSKCLWRIVLPNGKTKEVTASANSSHCRGSGNIFPLFPPPKVEKHNKNW